MLASTSLVFASLISLTSAHFQLQYPAARGKFVEGDEIKFCDGYDDPAANRIAFPLSGGVISLNSEHKDWTIGVGVATSANPTQFNDFKNVVPFFKDSGEGTACFTLDFSKTNATGLTDGQNVTIQVQFDAGDGDLFQCADLTLFTNATVPAKTCAGVTISSAPVNAQSSTAPSSPSSTSPSSTSTSPSSTSTSPSSTSTSPSSTSPSSTSRPSGSAVGRLHSSCLGIALGVLGLAATVA